MYCSVADMVARFGETEMIRLTTPDGQTMVMVQAQPISDAISYACGLIDTYLRKRYEVPLSVAPVEVTRAAMMIARYELSTGEQKTPSEQTRTERNDSVAWLQDVAAGKVLLDLQEVSSGDDSYAQVSTRDQVFL